MIVAPPDKNEAGRIRALNELKILDTDAEQNYDDLVMLAAAICNTPISLVSLVDISRQWFKSRVGLDACETSRDLAFCAHAILQPDLFVVPDTLQDERFADNPLVTGEPRIRFYAGAPLIDSDGFALGTLCVIDRQPRTLDGQQRKSLIALSKQVVSQFELRRKLIELQKINDNKQRIMTVLSHDLRNAFNVQINIANRLQQKLQQLSPTQISDCATMIARSAKDANRVLNEVLEWSKFEMGSYKMMPSEIDVAALLREVAQSCSAQALEKNVDIKQKTSSALTLCADKSMIECILRNLATNAIKFSRNGDTVILSAENAANHWRLSVIDHGVGMDSEHAGQLFGDKDLETTKGTAGETGTGIGTRLIQHFVAAHDGSIEVDSTPGKGTSIHITIPKPR